MSATTPSVTRSSAPTGVDDQARHLAHRVGALVESVLDRVGLGHLAHRVHQLVRYGAVSIIATLTSTTVLGALVATATLTPGWANAVATGVGTVPSFELNRRWVWGKTGRRSVTAEIGPFCALAFAGLALSTATVSGAGRWASSVGLPTGGRTAVVLAANVAAFGSLWVLQFVMLDRVLFARRSTGRDGSGDAPGQDAVRGARGRRPVADAAEAPRDVATGADALDHRVVPGGARVDPTPVVRPPAPSGRATVAA